MSHIDKALRVWEGSVGLDRSDDAPISSAGRASVHDYAREAPASASPPPPPRIEPLAPRPVPARPVVVETTPSALDGNAAARLVTSSASAISVEQYRRLAAALHDAQLNNGLKTVMVTSAVPREGKTLTAANLALTLSESYARRVLVIDADLRRPNVHAVFGVSNTRGLSDALADEHLQLPLVAVSERLCLLAAGEPGPMPLAGLSSPRMGALLEECGRHFDWVILDTPPVGVLPDAQLLARLAGAVVLVIAAGSTPAAVVERATVELGQECIIGTVLNRVDTRLISEAGYYDRYAYDQYAARQSHTTKPA